MTHYLSVDSSAVLKYLWLIKSSGTAFVRHGATALWNHVRWLLIISSRWKSIKNFLLKNGFWHLWRGFKMRWRSQLLKCVNRWNTRAKITDDSTKHEWMENVGEFQWIRMLIMQFSLQFCSVKNTKNFNKNPSCLNQMSEHHNAFHFSLDNSLKGVKFHYI